MQNIIVAGIGTEVGKTVVSAILTTYMNGDYWKPLQSGRKADSDTHIMSMLLDSANIIHPPAYSFEAPLSGMVQIWLTAGNSCNPSI